MKQEISMSKDQAEHTVIRAEFQPHTVHAGGRARMDAVNAAFSKLLDTVETYVPPGRERAIVATKLQEASMFAVRGIAVDPSAQTATDVVVEARA